MMRLLFQIRPLIPFLLALFSACSKNTSERESYTRLISAFEEAERAENVAFEKLVFRSAETPPPPGSTMAYKVMLRDQLDRPWVFLAGKSAAKHGAVAVYRIYNLFGVDTPETHYKKLSINGVEIDGIVQRHYPEAGPLRTEHFFLSPSSLEYIAQNHALSWLVANHSVLNQQFRITQAAPAGLTKLENGIDWYLLGNDRLSLDYLPPSLYHERSGGYGAFWRAYLHGGVGAGGRGTPESVLPLSTHAIQLDLQKIYNWVRFVGGFPEKDYLAFFSPAVSDKLDFLSKSPSWEHWMLSPETALGSKPEGFLAKISSRKRNFSSEMFSFYKQLIGLRGNTKELSSRETVDAVAKDLELRLQKRMERARGELGEIEKKGPLKQGELESPVNFEMYLAVIPLTRAISLPVEQRISFCNSVIGELEKIRSGLKFDQASKRPYLSDKRVLENAITKVKMLRDGPFRDPAIDQGYWLRAISNINDFFISPPAKARPGQAAN